MGEFELFINISSEFLEGFGGSGAGKSCWPSWTRFGKTGDPGVAGVAKSGLGVNSSSSSLATKRCPVIASPGLIEPLKPPFPSSFSLKKFGLTTRPIFLIQLISRLKLQGRVGYKTLHKIAGRSYKQPFEG